MTEIEIKARVKSHQVGEDNILKLGGKYLREDHQIDINYGRPQDLDENHLLREGTFVGRIRQDSRGIHLEFKEVRRDGGMREISALINKISDGECLFKALGYEKAFSIEKNRKRFELEGFEIALDTVKDLGCFIEVEHGSKDGMEIEAGLADCRSLLRQIDDQAVIERRKYGDLMQEMLNETKR